MKTLIRFLTSWARRKKRPRELDASGHNCQACRRHSYQTMAQNICTVLRMAAEPVTPKTVMAFVASLPLSEHDINCAEWRAGYCNLCLYKAFENTPESERYGRFHELLCYFANDFVRSSDFHKQDVMDAMLGILGGFALDATLGLYHHLLRLHQRPPTN